MSRMSQLHAELLKQASELGFETIQDAVNSGYIVDYSKGKLVKRGLGYSEAVAYLTQKQKEAHKAWLKERHEVLHLLESIKEDIINLTGGNNNHPAIDDLDYIIDFIEKGEV